METVIREPQCSLKKRIQAYAYCIRKEVILSSEMVINPLPKPDLIIQCYLHVSLCLYRNKKSPYSLDLNASNVALG